MTRSLRWKENSLRTGQALHQSVALVARSLTDFATIGIDRMGRASQEVLRRAHQSQWARRRCACKSRSALLTKKQRKGEEGGQDSEDITSLVVHALPSCPCGKSKPFETHAEHVQTARPSGAAAWLPHRHVPPAAPIEELVAMTLHKGLGQATWRHNCVGLQGQTSHITVFHNVLTGPQCAAAAVTPPARRQLPTATRSAPRLSALGQMMSLLYVATKTAKPDRGSLLGYQQRNEKTTPICHAFPEYHTPGKLHHNTRDWNQGPQVKMITASTSEKGGNNTTSDHWIDQAH